MPNTTIDNVILENKHYYMQSLKNIETLRKKMEYEVLNNDIPQDRLKEILKVWNYLFIGLLREGLSYDYIKDAKNPQKDIIRLTIDNVHYDCPLQTVKAILQDDFSSIIRLNDNLSVADKQAIHIHTTTIPQEKSKMEEKQEKISSIPATSKEKVQNNDKKKKILNKKEEDIPIDDKSADNVPEKTEKILVDEKRLQTEVKNEIAKENQNTQTEDVYITHVPENLEKTKGYYNDVFENQKAKNTFIYDSYKATIFHAGANIGDEIEIIIAPLRIAENDIHTDIFVAMKHKDIIECFVSEKNSAIEASFMNYDFLLRGVFKEGEFISYITLGKVAISMGCQINKEKTEFRIANKINSHYGHIVYNANGVIVNIIPLTFKNNEKETADVLVCLEGEKQQRQVFASVNADSLIISANEATVQIINYWQDNYLCSEILNIKK